MSTQLVLGIDCSTTACKALVFDSQGQEISAIPTTYFMETVLLGGAYTISWFMDNFAVDSAMPQGSAKEQWFEEAAQNIPVGSKGLICVPYWNSVMNPYWDASASGIVTGWRGNHTPQHFYRAILEGIAFELRLHKLGVETATRVKIEHFFAVGGGAKNKLWCQTIADVINANVQRTLHRETAALGAGIVAAAGAGIYGNIADAARAMAALDPVSFKPNVERHKLYREIFENVYRELYPVLQLPLRRLAETTASQQ